MATCINHPDTSAHANCAHCLKAFCANCLVELQGRTLCGNCKNSVARAVQSAPTAFKEPRDALIAAIVGIFCFQPIISPYALYKGIKVLRMIRLNPSLPGKGMAITAVVVSSVITALSLIYLLVVLVAVVMASASAR